MVGCAGDPARGGRCEGAASTLGSGDAARAEESLDRELAGKPHLAGSVAAIAHGAGAYLALARLDGARPAVLAAGGHAFRPTRLAASIAAARPVQRTRRPDIPPDGANHALRSRALRRALHPCAGRAERRRG